MEDKSRDFSTNLENVDKKHVIRIQALIRGALVRKWMQDVRDSFTEVVKIIEEGQHVGVEWRRQTLCHPKVSRHCHRRWNTLKTTDETIAVENPVKNVNQASKNLISYAENMKEPSGQNTVETQTSFIDISSSASYGKYRDIGPTSFPGHGNEDCDNKMDTEEQPMFLKMKPTSVDLETELESIHSDDAKSHGDLPKQQILTYQRLSPCSDARLQLSDTEGDISVISENLDSGRNSAFSRKSNFSTANGRRASKFVQETEVEPFPQSDSDRSRESNRSVKSNKDSCKIHRDRPISDNVNNDADDLNIDLHLESARSDKSQGSNQNDDFFEEENLDTRLDVDRLDSGRSSNSQISRQSRSSSKSYGNAGKHPSSDQRDQSPISERSGKSVKSRRSTKSMDSHESQAGKVSTRSVKQNIVTSIPTERRGNVSPVSDRSEVSLKSNRSGGSLDSYKSDRHKITRPSVDHDIEKKSIMNDTEENHGESPVSDRSETSIKSRDSERSKKSSKSHRSDRSQHSDRSGRSYSTRQGKQSELQGPRPSSASPVPVRRRDDEVSVKRQSLPKSDNQDSTALTNVTSVWDSVNSFRESHDFQMPPTLPDDVGQLTELRKNISMEILWVQQAIDSRKNYLKLKNKM